MDWDNLTLRLFSCHVNVATVGEGRQRLGYATKESSDLSSFFNCVSHQLFEARGYFSDHLDSVIT
jgi:hypothetical protein